MNKFESNEEKSRVGALTVIKHLLNLPTKTLNYRLEEITKSIHANLGEEIVLVMRLFAFLDAKHFYNRPPKSVFVSFLRSFPSIVVVRVGS